MTSQEQSTLVVCPHIYNGERPLDLIFIERFGFTISSNQSSHDWSNWHGQNQIAKQPYLRFNIPNWSDKLRLMGVLSLLFLDTNKLIRSVNKTN